MTDTTPAVFKDEPKLHRSIGPTQLALYGLGSMLGAGIYGLIGQAAGIAGNAVWLAFIASLVVALLTALSYASLISRYPRAAGAAYVAQRAYRIPMLSFVVGIAVVCSGLTSVATQSRVLARNIVENFPLGAWGLEIAGVGFLLIMAGVAFRGIRESMWMNVLCTLVEAAGLIIVILVGMSFWGSVNLLETPKVAAGGSDLFFIIILNGAVLTFFAFLGFEDTINVAEECKNPETTLPIGLIAAMTMAAILYIAVAITAVSVVPYGELATAGSPLTAVVSKAAPTFPSWVFTVITVFAVANTALVNYVTASRLVYGMSRQGLMPAPLGRVHKTTKTPHLAILLLLLVLIPLVLTSTVSNLAQATVLLLLTVFCVVNAALVVLKMRPGEKPGKFEVPVWVPALGAIVCAVLIFTRVSSGDWVAPALAGGMLAATLVLYLAMRPIPFDQD
jgi:basic amino acid/polyamine antiporter, APA family